MFFPIFTNGCTFEGAAPFEGDALLRMDAHNKRYITHIASPKSALNCLVFAQKKTLKLHRKLAMFTIIIACGN